jgi:hypothetical protein
MEYYNKVSAEKKPRTLNEHFNEYQRLVNEAYDYKSAHINHTILEVLSNLGVDGAIHFRIGKLYLAQDDFSSMVVEVSLNPASSSEVATHIIPGEVWTAADPVRAAQEYRQQKTIEKQAEQIASLEAQVKELLEAQKVLSPLSIFASVFEGMDVMGNAGG